MPPTPTTDSLSVTTARRRFSELLNQVFRRDRRVVIEKQGIPVAALISAEDADRLAEYERQRAEDFDFLDRIRERFADTPLSEHQAEIEQALHAVRRERRDGSRDATVQPDRR